MTDVFISYSRKDTDFVRALFEALQAQKREAWIDWQGIDYSTHWWEEICTGIEGADNFVLILSSDALNSVYCHREIEHARKNSKRIIPILYQPIDEVELTGSWYVHSDFRQHEVMARQNWEELKSIQWIDFGKLGSLASVTEALISTINIDPKRLRLHTQLLLRVRDWESRGQSSSVLLRGDELNAFEAWYRDSQTSGERPYPTANQLAFLIASRKGEDTRLRNQIIAIMIGVFLLAASVVLGWVGMQSQERADAAVTQVSNANATLTPLAATLQNASQKIVKANQQIESGQLASFAISNLNKPDGNIEFSALAAIRSLNINYSQAADIALMQASDQLKTEQVYRASANIVKVAISPSGDKLLTSASDSHIQIWNSKSGTLFQTFTLKTGIVANSASFSPQGDMIVLGCSDGITRLVDVKTGIEKFNLDGNASAIRSVAFSHNGIFILTGDEKGNLRLWNAASGLLRWQHSDSFRGYINLESSPILDVAFSTDDRVAWAANTIGATLPFETDNGDEQTGTIRGEFNANSAISLAFRSDIGLIAHGVSGEIVIGSVDDKGQTSIRLRGHTGYVTSVTFSPENKFLATGGTDNTVRLWDLSSGAEVQRFTGHSDIVSSLAFSPDGRWLFSSSRDQTVRRWRTELGNSDFYEYPVKHTDQISQVVVSPNGRYFATASRDKTVRVWDRFRRVEIQQMAGHTAPVTSIAFSPDGAFIATGSEDNTTRLWELSTGKELRKIGTETAQISSLTFGSDGQTLAISTNHSFADLWDLQTGRLLRSFTLPGKSNLGNHALSVSPDGKWLAVSGYEEGGLWEWSTGRLVQILPPPSTGTPTNMIFSPDSKHLAFITGLSPVTFTSIDIESGEKLEQMLFESSAADVNALAFTLDGEGILLQIDYEWVLRNLRTGTLRWSGHKFQLNNTMVLSPDGEFVVAGTVEGNVVEWSLIDNRDSRILKAHSSAIWNAAFSPDGKYVVTTNSSDPAHLWNVDSGSLIRRFDYLTLETKDNNSNQVTSIGVSSVSNAIFSPDAKFLLLCGRDMAVVVNVVEPDIIQFYKPPHPGRGQNVSIWSAAFSPDGKFLVTVGDSTSGLIWDRSSMKILAELKGHQDSITSVKFSSDGTLILTTSLDGTARLWDFTTKQQLAVYKHPGIRSAAISPDGTIIVTASQDTTAKLWSVKSQTEIRRFVGHTQPITSVTISPNGNLLLTGSDDRTARLWDIQSGLEIRRYVGHTDSVSSVSFSPNGRLVLTASYDVTARLWDTDFKDSLSFVCKNIFRDFTDLERKEIGITDSAPTCPSR